MKQISFYILVLFAVFCSSAIAQSYTADVTTYRLNKVGAHAQNYDADASFATFLMHGWRSCSFSKVPANLGYIASVAATLSDWHQVSLPNILASDDSVALYANDFLLPSSWSSHRRTFVKVGAASSALSVYVNGRYVGYSEDSFAPAEWDITRYLSSGNNRILLVVHPSSTGSLVDSIPLLLNGRFIAPPRGILQPVQLYSLPSIYISDYRVSALVDTLGEGYLEVAVDLSREVSSHMVVEVLLSQSPLSSHFSNSDVLYSSRRRLDIRDWFTTLPKGRVGHVDAWSPSSPSLYYLTIRLKSANDSVWHTILQPIGFHSLAINRSMLFLNNASFCPHIQILYPPLAASRDSLLSLLSSLKQSQCNMIRLVTPAPEPLYNICDSLGIAIWNCCTFADASSNTSSNDEFLEHYIYRVYNLLHRDRNHPSLLLWGASFSTNPLDTLAILPSGVCVRRAIKFFSDKDNIHPFVMGLAPHPGICYLPYFCYFTPLLNHIPYAICYSSLAIAPQTYPLNVVPRFNFEMFQQPPKSNEQIVQKKIKPVYQPRKKRSWLRRILSRL